MRGERGSVSVVAAAVIALMIVLVMGASDLARVVVAASVAQSAADAAALAAAQEMALGSPTEPLDRATEYAAANGATLVSCDCTTGRWIADVRVQVAVGALLIARGGGWVSADARAIVELPPA